MMNSMMTPVLILVLWTLIMLLFMGGTRFLIGFRSDPSQMKKKRTQDLELPPAATWVADNYNHLHEQPTIFYALAVYSHLVGVADPLNVHLAWAYVASRIAHSLVHSLGNIVPVRFLLFVVGSVLLLVMTVRNLIALTAGA